jgi:transketolase N-terminal domain/subunit
MIALSLPLGSGYTGGILSVMGINATLYLKYIKYDPGNLTWEDRDEADYFLLRAMAVPNLIGLIFFEWSIS